MTKSPVIPDKNTRFTRPIVCPTTGEHVSAETLYNRCCESLGYVVDNHIGDLVLDNMSYGAPMGEVDTKEMCDAVYAWADSVRAQLSPPIPHGTDIERKIVGKVVECLLRAHYRISVYDGEETTVRNATEGAAIWHALASTDADTLNVCRTDGRRSFVFLVWGNGVDIISDYGISLEEVLKPAFDLAESLDDRGQA